MVTSSAPGTLYLVATPIGNLEDITLRALRVLREVPLVAAEDTRTARKLLGRHGIANRLLSYHDNSPPVRRDRLIAHLLEGKDLALISEAGTPGLSDPGYRLVRQALDQGIEVVPVPGASALLPALTASGLPLDRFVFEGFLPARAAARDKRIYALADEPRTLVFYESPRRLPATLQALAGILGPGREAAVARELTKKFEEFIRGPLSEVRRRLEETGVRGEVVLIVAGAGERPGVGNPVREVERLIAEMGISRMEAIKLVARRRGESKSSVYRRVHGGD